MVVPAMTLLDDQYCANRFPGRKRTLPSGAVVRIVRSFIVKKWLMAGLGLFAFRASSTAQA